MSPGILDRYHGYPAIAASAINPAAGGAFPLVAPAAGAVERGVVPVASNNVLALGAAEPASKAIADPVTVHEQGAVVEAVAAASLGAGAEVGFATSNGALAPVAAAASGVLRTSAGVAQSPAAPGEYFSLYVRPRVVSDGGPA